MLTICLAYDNDNDYKRLLNALDIDYYIEAYNLLSKKGKSSGWKLKNKWGAKLNPFIEVKEEDNTLKCFYSEEKVDIIEQLKNWIQNDYKQH